MMLDHEQIAVYTCNHSGKYGEVELLTWKIIYFTKENGLELDTPSPRFGLIERAGSIARDFVAKRFCDDAPPSHPSSPYLSHIASLVRSLRDLGSGYGEGEQFAVYLTRCLMEYDGWRYVGEFSDFLPNDEASIRAFLEDTWEYIGEPELDRFSPVVEFASQYDDLNSFGLVG